MALFGFLKKRREEQLPLPPPPSPPENIPQFRGDIEPIRGQEISQTPMAPLPPMEHEEPPLPELPPALPAPTPAREKEARTYTTGAEKVFDKTITEEQTEMPAEKIRVIPKPAFVDVEDYKRIINDTNTIRSKLMDAENFVRKLSDIKNEEERAFEKWRTQLEDVEKKLNYVDQLIAKAQG